MDGEKQHFSQIKITQRLTIIIITFIVIQEISFIDSLSN